MKIKSVACHIAAVSAALFLTAALPVIAYFGPSGGNKTDTVSSASIKLPDKPSGEFIVIINETLHKNTVGAWTDFFTDSNFAVIFEDIHCAVSSSDVTGGELAERFAAQLPENQMMLRYVDPVLLASKVETGHIDVAVFSSEMAKALQLDTDKFDGLTVISVKGGD